MAADDVVGRVVVGQRVSEGKMILANGMRHTMIPSEGQLWERLRGSKLGMNFRRQQIIDGFIADFYCHTARLVIEVDGPIHEPDYDAERDGILSARGISVLRFTNDQVAHQIGVVLYTIKQRLQSAGT